MSAPDPQRRADLVKVGVALLALIALVVLLLLDRGRRPNPAEPAPAPAAGGSPNPPPLERPAAEPPPAVSAPRAPSVTYPPDGAEVTVETVRLFGWGDPGAGVEVTLDGRTIASTEVSADSRWTTTVTLEPGERRLVLVSERSGQRSAESVVTYRMVPTGRRDGQ